MEIILHKNFLIKLKNQKCHLGYNDKNKPKSKVGRDILFIERNLNFIKPGGRMAIVLPQGRFNNTSDKNGHLIISHDLHNHDGELPDGVAEKFIELAKNEKLSFWR